MRHVLIISILMLGLISTASADYLKGQIGYTLNAEIDDGTTTELDSQILSPFTFGIGKVLNPAMALEFEIQRYSNEFDGSGGGFFPDASFDLIGLGMNFIFSPLGIEGDMVPYFGAGLTLGFASVDFLGVSTDSETGFNLNAMAGMLFKTGQGWSAGGEARYSLSISDYDSLDVSYLSLGVVFTYQLKTGQRGAAAQ